MWGRNEYYKTDILEELYKSHNDNIQRVHYNDLSVEQFNERFDKPQIPCIIQGVLEAEGWHKEKYWTWNKFIEYYGDARLKIAESDKGKTIRAPCQAYYKYLLHQKDDSPLYMFQS